VPLACIRDDDTVIDHSLTNRRGWFHEIADAVGWAKDKELLLGIRRDESWKKASAHREQRTIVDHTAKSYRFAFFDDENLSSRASIAFIKAIVSVKESVSHYSIVQKYE
jgi:hypothetical protein